MTKKKPGRFGKEPESALIAWDLTEMEKISLKKFYAECSMAGINTRPLIKLLSTLYGNNMVIRGHVSTLSDKLRDTPILLDRKTLTSLAELTMESAWMIDSISGGQLSVLEETKGQLSS